MIMEYLVGEELTIHGSHSNSMTPKGDPSAPTSRTLKVDN